MTLHLRPVGPLPAGVYWRRRAVVAVVLLLLLVLLSRCGGEEPQALVQAAPSPSPSTAAPATPGTAPAPATTPPVALPSSPAAVQPCADAVLRVTATPSRPSYAAGSRPVLRLAVRNGGAVPCLRALGSAAVELLVLSGDDRIWSSDDCTRSSEQGPVVLRPQELRVITVTWAGRRSRPGCPAGAEAIERGTYRVVGRVGTLRTAGSPFLAG